MYVRLCDFDIPRKKKAKLLANFGDPDQMLHFTLLTFITEKGRGKKERIEEVHC